MKKCLLCLLMLLLLLAPAALAEDAAAYQPGSITKELFAEAFARGDMLMADLHYTLSLDAEGLGLTDEDAAMLEPIAKALQNATLTLGAAKLDSGLRILLGGEYADGGESAALTAALDVTAEGLALESSVIPGERVTAKWETLLSLAGMSEEEIAQLMSLREVGLDALIAELTAQIEPMLDMAAQIGAPYLETISAHIAALPMELRENVPAEYGYPAVAAEIYVQISQKAVSDLIIALADQLEQDATLCAIIDALLAETAEGTSAPTAADLCAAIRESFASMTDEAYPLHVYLGVNETGAPSYLNVFKEREDGTVSVLNLVTAPGEAEGSTALIFDLVDMTAEQEALDGLSLSVEYIADPVNSNVLDLAAALSVYAGGSQIAAADFSMNNAAIVTEDGQDGYAGSYALAMDIADAEETVSISMDFETIQARTADAGEQALTSGTMEITAGGVIIPSTFETSMITVPGESGPVSTFTELISMPAMGVNECQETYSLYTQPYDPAASAALTETALETASQEALEALLMRGMTELEAVGTKLAELLPPEIIEMITESTEAAQPAA